MFVGIGLKIRKDESPLIQQSSPAHDDRKSGDKKKKLDIRDVFNQDDDEQPMKKRKLVPLGKGENINDIQGFWGGT